MAVHKQRNNTTEDYAFHDMDFSGSQVLDEIFNPQDPGTWDKSAVAIADWLNAPTHSGDGCDYNFLGDLPTS